MPIQNFPGTFNGVNIGEAWTTPPFDAGAFMASNSMTWTVAEGDVTTYEYLLIGKTMFLNFSIETTTVGGTPSYALILAIPAGKLISKPLNNVYIADDNGTVGFSILYVPTDGTSRIFLYKNLAANDWTASTNLTGVKGSLVFGIQ